MTSFFNDTTVLTNNNRVLRKIMGKLKEGINECRMENILGGKNVTCDVIKAHCLSMYKNSMGAHTMKGSILSVNRQVKV